MQTAAWYVLSNSAAVDYWTFSHDVTVEGLIGIPEFAMTLYLLWSGKDRKCHCNTIVL